MDRLRAQEVPTGPEWDRAKDGWRRKSTLIGLGLPALVALIGASVPHFSLTWTVIDGAPVAFCALWWGLLVVSGRWVSRRWLGAYMAAVFDALAFIAVTIAWRIFGSDLAAGIVLFGLLPLLALGGHVWRRPIMQELHAPRTSLGVRLAAFGSVGGAGGGALGYGIGRAFGLSVVAGVMVAAAYYMVIAIHATWLKIEDPRWEPEPPRPAASVVRAR
jgi:hypothetical protein